MFSGLFAKRPTGPDATTIEHEALKEALKGGACVLVDVREPHEYSAGHIPGAVNHPLSRFDAKHLPSGKPVVLVCKSGGRSSTALRQALASGRQDVCHYPGGTLGWHARGGEVVKK
ncbi:putative sulfurtransferase (Rhodanese) [Methylocella tundrae]|uniref:Putative sulfurtransferase (Rhodanese) n=1 Tax=Methylocella tundrae TaxID=227605 RepID=A0A4U8Z794_METTU|nr:rhodanese-like domain-containing protein [Methylocella tundrae]WPP03018.1 rhodanese-like domain-containing protein [Methylocella tundrae]VFU16764.1 putative sulfurtransferase (Rhodanese) [Methylocella tundrae]VTZ51917.1 putative sulfurtransferase (Rhodanese) [Methylocella tundrae]